MSVLGIRTRASRFRYGLDYGRMVRERSRFAANEALNRWKTASYRLRDGGMAIVLRHHPSPEGTPSIDTWTLREIFRDGAYRVPPEVELPAAPRIVDLGANIGLFTVFMLRSYPAAQITAFEPDPDNARLLRETVRRNGCTDGFVLHEVCAMPADGLVRFSSGGHQFSRISDGDEEEIVQLPGVDVFPFLEEVDLLKMDVEGAEWALLADQRFGAARNIVMEYHPMLCPSPDPRALLGRLLEDRGYRIVVDDEPMVWAVHDRLGEQGAGQA